ncbi:hypothetical protein Tco_0429022 [Tanacetum coccineum]
MYPPTTSESSAGDSSSEFSAGPSCKRCRSPAAIAISYIHATRALVPSRANLLPPRKRFRDSISPEDSVEEDIDTDVLEDIEADAMAIEVVVDREIATGVNASIDMEVDVEVDVKDEVEFNDRGNMEVGVDVATGINILDAMVMPDAVEHLEQVEEGLQDIYKPVMKIPLQRIEDIETGQRGLEARSLIAGRERASLLKHVASLERSNVDPNGGNGNGGDGNGNGGNGILNENDRDARPVARYCTYQDFMKCQPLNFKGTEGVFELIKWFNKMEISLTVKNNDLAAYTQRFQELTMMCTKMVPEEEDRVEKLIELKGYAMKNAENKRKFDNSQKDNRGQQPPNKRQNVRGHYRSDFLKLKDQNRGNKTRNKNGVGEARGKAYVLGADQSFVSTTFSTLLDMIPDTLDVSYAIELADGRISEN